MKTLKDMTFWNKVTDTSGKNVGEAFLNISKQKTFTERMLKKEAIKWIKELSKFKGYAMDNEGNSLDDKYRDFRDSGAGEYCDSTYGNVINWIMHFFNIEDKDVK